jgi:hypothetical protein
MPNPIEELVSAMDSGQQPQPPLAPEEGDTQEKLKQELLKEEKEMCFDYQKAKPYLTELATRWNTSEQLRTESNRLTRDVDIEVDGLREEGLLEDDEAFIPDRVIDLNIQREMPSDINYLKNSRRVATFRDVLDPTYDTDLLEQEFTRVVTYKGWVVPFYKEFDAAKTHGWASMEVLYDESKPGNASIEYIAHENLIFAQDAEDIQNCICVLRRYMLTPLVLKQWVNKFGFDFQQVMLLIEKTKGGDRVAVDKTIEVYKRFHKYNGQVYVSWFSKDSACTDWLKKPVPLYVGIDELVDTPVPQQSPVGTSPQMPQPQTNAPPMGQPMGIPQMTKTWKPSPVTNYPIFILPYKQTEKPYIFDFKGRVFYDKDKQEFNTSIKTAFCNGLNRSTKVFASPQGDPINDGKPAKLLADIQWQNGGVFDKQMNFWTMPCPNPLILKTLESMADENLEDIGQTSYATMNRQDSRKTATEIKGAEQQSQQLDSVDLTILSEHLRDIYSFFWLIIRSQALQGRIKFLQITPPQQQGQVAGQVGQVGQPQQQGQLPMGMSPQLPPQIQSIVNSAGNYQQEAQGRTNDIDTLIRMYDVRAAGDVDVVQKQDLVQSMMQDWPVVQTTPLASTFLVDLMKLKYPQNSDRYATILQQGNPKNQVIQSLGTIVKALVNMPGVKEHIQPQQMKQLAQIEQEAMQALQTP